MYEEDREEELLSQFEIFLVENQDKDPYDLVLPFANAHHVNDIVVLMWLIHVLSEFGCGLV